MIQPVKDVFAAAQGVQWDVLRIDLLHPVVSGNKWFKLRPCLDAAIRDGQRGVLSFGGAWSNHLHALAYAAREAGLQSVGIVRGEEPPILSPTLEDARAWGMELAFVPRKTYAALSMQLEPFQGDQTSPPNSTLASSSPATIKEQGITDAYKDFLVIPTGGYGPLGMTGAAGILDHIPRDTYTHILCAVGTGTMYAGLLSALFPYPTSEIQLPKFHFTPILIGIPVLRNEISMENDIRRLLPASLSLRPVPRVRDAGNGMQDWPIRLDHRFHGGGYAKTSAVQLAFMRSFYESSGIPTDIIYTSKLMYAVKTLIEEGFFPAGSRILAIHSGGLQGNRSLKKGILPY